MNRNWSAAMSEDNMQWTVNIIAEKQDGEQSTPHAETKLPNAKDQTRGEKKQKPETTFTVLYLSSVQSAAIIIMSTHTHR